MSSLLKKSLRRHSTDVAITLPVRTRRHGLEIYCAAETLADDEMMIHLHLNKLTTKKYCSLTPLFLSRCVHPLFGTPTRANWLHWLLVRPYYTWTLRWTHNSGVGYAFWVWQTAWMRFNVWLHWQRIDEIIWNDKLRMPSKGDAVYSCKWSRFSYCSTTNMEQSRLIILCICTITDLSCWLTALNQSKQWLTFL